ncbi:hypothetical protein MAR_006155 [Mya arenaria]|uniref:Uncharacterized protein n=1 Tax=Mya arenaria TaxID=6604 RepID=A0ABY7D8I8_MYAAR|nr:uncharacterized protein LOC128233775 [Mya arenaria]WAQ93684.1 hypothetical protein MAR_006155 [Mya arenaria]
MKGVLLLAFAFVHVCTGREIVKKNAVIFEFDDSDERDLAYYDASSFDDEADEIFDDEDLEALKYPDDCKHSNLIDAANQGGCKAKAVKNQDTSVYKEKFVTSIPHSVKSNPTCKSIINELNAQCSDELDYPGDCKTSKLINVANKGGCSVKAGKTKHSSVFKIKHVTSIPKTVKKDSTCEAIIKALNANC